MKKDEFLKIVKKDEELSRHSSYQIGGKAKYFLALDSQDKIIEILDYCQENNIRFFILGGGSNILFPDEGFEGLVIKYYYHHLK
jgi:UDP-N-acetylmuramate dehydrogenase